MKLPIVVATSVVLVSLAPQVAVASPREYNHGYHDCLRGAFDRDEYEDSRSYRQGCQEAREEGRGEERPSYWERDRRPAVPPPGPFTLPRPMAGIPNVNGMDPVRALQTFASRGYRNVGTSVVGGAIAGIYFNPQTRECVQATSMNGRVVNTIPSGDSRCR